MTFDSDLLYTFYWSENDRLFPIKDHSIGFYQCYLEYGFFIHSLALIVNKMSNINRLIKLAYREQLKKQIKHIIFQVIVKLLTCLLLNLK